MDDCFPFCGIFGLDGQFRWGYEKTRDNSLMTLPFALWRPPEFLVVGAEGLAEWESVMEKFEVKDVEFEEDYVEVIRLTVNPLQIHSSGVDPYWT